MCACFLVHSTNDLKPHFSEPQKNNYSWAPYPVCAVMDDVTMLRITTINTSVLVARLARKVPTAVLCRRGTIIRTVCCRPAFLDDRWNGSSCGIMFLIVRVTGVCYQDVTRFALSVPLKTDRGRDFMGNQKSAKKQRHTTHIHTNSVSPHNNL